MVIRLSKKEAEGIGIFGGKSKTKHRVNRARPKRVIPSGVRKRLIRRKVNKKINIWGETAQKRAKATRQKTKRQVFGTIHRMF